MIWLYALVGDAHAPLAEGLQGLGGAPVRAVRVGDVVAVVSTALPSSAATDREAVLVHARVTERLHRERPTLPVRFGTAYADAAALVDDVGARAAALAATLERVRGHVEIGLRVLWDETGPGPRPEPIDGSGRAYMAARAEEDRADRAWRERADRCAAQVHQPLEQLAAASVHRVLETPATLLTAAYLIPSEAVERFRGTLDATAARAEPLRLLATGPWPPYHFADLGG